MSIWAVGRVKNHAKVTLNRLDLCVTRGSPIAGIRPEHATAHGSSGILALGTVLPVEL
jgi:hypothetical protein